MAYTIIRADGNILTTVADNIIDSTSTSLSLPGRNYASYGQPVDTNWVRMLENWASVTVPPNPIRGQIWFNIANSAAPRTQICPQDGETNSAAWLTLISTDVYGNVTLDPGNIAVPNGNISANNFLSSNILQGNTGVIFGATDSTTTTTGALTVAGGVGIVKNLNVGANVSVANNMQAANVRTANLRASAGTGTIFGTWTLGAGATLQATYADLAERFEADDSYPAGTVVELGGTHEITATTTECSENILGVVSHSAAYIMNSAIANNDTHPPIAMAGRVPVRVIGTVRKGDRLVSSGHPRGYARSARKNEATPFSTVGRALENKTTEGLGEILAVVSAKL